MNGIEYDICYTQQRIYEHMASEKYDMRGFSDAYLKCDFCRRAMDTCYSRFQLEDVYECMDFYMPEIGASLVKTDGGQNIEAAAWIGFMYRYLFISTGIMSAELVQKVTYDVMLAYYPGLHTIDEDMAIDIICKDFSLERNRVQV